MMLREVGAEYFFLGAITGALSVLRSAGFTGAGSSVSSRGCPAAGGMTFTPAGTEDGESFTAGAAGFAARAPNMTTSSVPLRVIS